MRGLSARGRLFLGVGMIVAFGGLGVLITAKGVGSSESRLIERSRTRFVSETSIVKVSFPTFLNRTRNSHPNWIVGFTEHWITFRAPGSPWVMSVSPGFINPGEQWTDLGNSEQWTTVRSEKPRHMLDFLWPEFQSTDHLIDIPLKYWGQSDRYGFSLKKDQLPAWLTKLYDERTASAISREVHR